MEFLNYFSNVFTFGNILILILGTIGGLLMGAAPGLSPTMAVALLLTIYNNWNRLRLITEETNLIGAEGATTPETLRQKDRT